MSVLMPHTLYRYVSIQCPTPYTDTSVSMPHTLYRYVTFNASHLITDKSLLMPHTLYRGKFKKVLHPVLSCPIHLVNEKIKTKFRLFFFLISYIYYCIVRDVISSPRKRCVNVLRYFISMMIVNTVHHCMTCPTIIGILVQLMIYRVLDVR